MRVLVVTNMYPSAKRPHFGTFVHEQVESLRALAVHVDVHWVDGASDRRSYLRAFGEVRAQVAAGSYDLVHAHYALSVAVARAQRLVPLVATFHGSEVAFSFTAPLSKFLAPRVEGVIVTSQRVKMDLGYEDATVIPCGVNLDLFKPMPQQEARQHLGLLPDRKYVLFAGRKDADKRIPLLEQAVSQIRRTSPHVELLVVSGKPLQEVPLYMNACDVFTLISDYEGSPQVIKEAMACNLPIVSCDVGDVPEVIGNTPGCYICRNKTPEDVALHLQRALDFGGRTEGRDAVAVYSMPTIAERLVNYYETLLARQGRTVKAPSAGKLTLTPAADTHQTQRNPAPEHNGEDRVMRS